MNFILIIIFFVFITSLICLYKSIMGTTIYVRLFGIINAICCIALFFEFLFIDLIDLNKFFEIFIFCIIVFLFNNLFFLMNKKIGEKKIK